MTPEPTSFKKVRSESGQSILVVSVSLAALVLLVSGAMIFSAALFTSYAVRDPEKSQAFSQWLDSADISETLTQAVDNKPASPSLGAIVGNQVYLVDPVGVSLLDETGTTVSMH